MRTCEAREKHRPPASELHPQGRRPWSGCFRERSLEATRCRPHHGGSGRRSERDRHLRASRGELGIPARMDAAPHLSADGCDSGDQRPDRAHHRPRDRRQSSRVLPERAAPDDRRSAAGGERTESRSRSWRDGRMSATADARASGLGVDRILRQCLHGAAADLLACALRRRPQMADPGSAHVLRRSCRRPNILARGAQRTRVAGRVEQPRLLAHGGGAPRHDDQPLPFLLASGAGGRGHQGPPAAGAAAAQARAGPLCARPHSHRYADRNGNLEPGGTCDSHHHRGDAVPVGHPPSDDGRAGRASVAATRRPLRLLPLHGWTHRIRTPRRAGPRGICRLCHRRGATLARRARAQAPRGQGLLRHDRSRDPRRGAGQRRLRPPHASPRLGRSHQRHRRSSRDGAADADGDEPPRHGDVSDLDQAASARVGGNRPDAARGGGTRVLGAARASCGCRGELLDIRRSARSAGEAAAPSPPRSDRAAARGRHA